MTDRAQSLSLYYHIVFGILVSTDCRTIEGEQA